MVLANVGINNQTFVNGGGSISFTTGVFRRDKNPQMFFEKARDAYRLPISTW